MDLQKTPSIFCCYTPSQVVCVDDNPVFLGNFKANCPSMAHVTFDHSFEALRYLKANAMDQAVKRWVSAADDQNNNQAITQIDLRDIHHDVYNPARFREISVLFIDYEMPGLKGLEICEALKDTPMKKVLLTAEASADLAVEAFNKKLIDQFIPKKDLKKINLEQLVRQLQHAYFTEKSQHVIDAMAHIAEPLVFLTDPVFLDFFAALREQYQIVEYYLLDNQGSFLMLDRRGNPFWLVVKDDQAMQELTEFAEIQEAPSHIYNALKTRASVPFFYSDQDFAAATTDWSQYMHSAKEIFGNKQYYFAVVAQSAAQYDLRCHDIVSYQTFLEHRNAAAMGTTR